MPETNVNFRRWSGYVCPDCRLVFRVMRDLAGQGVVCPSCRRLLRIPTADDRPPPLLAPAPAAVPPPAEAAGGSDGPRRGRRSRKTRRASALSWDVGGSDHAPRERQGGWPVWQLSVGAVAFVGVVVGIAVAALGNRHGAPPPVVPVPAQVVTTQSAPGEPATAPGRSETEFLAEAEPLVRKFLEARQIADLLEIVRNPVLAEPRMRRQYPQGTVEPLGLASFNERSILRAGAISMLSVRTRDLDERMIAVVDTPAGLKVDWESWVGWCDTPWAEFLSNRPSRSSEFRLNLSKANYYNFDFADDKKWQCYRLTSVDDQFAIYGYVEIGSALNSELMPSTQATNQKVPMVLALKFPADAKSRDQVLIEKIVCESWVKDNESPPP